MEDFTFKSMKLVRSYDIYREKNAEDAYVKPVPQAGLEPLALKYRVLATGLAKALSTVRGVT